MFFSSQKENLSVHHHFILPACLLLTLMLFSFIPQRYVAANEAVSVISLVSWRHFPQSAFVH